MSLHNIANSIKFLGDVKITFGMVVFVIIFIIVLTCTLLNKKEGFYYRYHPYTFYNGWCYGREEEDCLKCSNCGLCDGKCARGDRFGPADGRKCKTWKHTDILNEPDYDKLWKDDYPCGFSSKYGSYYKGFFKPNKDSYLRYLYYDRN